MCVCVPILARHDICVSVSGVSAFMPTQFLHSLTLWFGVCVYSYTSVVHDVFFMVYAYKYTCTRVYTCICWDLGIFKNACIGVCTDVSFYVGMHRSGMMRKRHSPRYTDRWQGCSKRLRMELGYTARHVPRRMSLRCSCRALKARSLRSARCACVCMCVCMCVRYVYVSL